MNFLLKKLNKNMLYLYIVASTRMLTCLCGILFLLGSTMEQKMHLITDTGMISCISSLLAKFSV